MFVLSILYIYIATVLNERALPSYKKDEGQPPAWLATEVLKKKAAVERWFIDTNDATCKPFTYLGSLGNFNNFVSRSACNEHLKFKPEEQADSCSEQQHDGSCGLTGKNRLERWYFKAGDHNGKKNSCHSFLYNGCGGNANNFESAKECEQACQNTKNGKATGVTDANTLTSIPNSFDCKFKPEVKTATPQMGIVPHKDGKKCVYAAVGEEATRGFFEDLPTCVKTCIDPLVAACAADGPYQIILTNKLTNSNEATVYYYFNKNEKLCLPFMSKTITGTDPKIDDGTLNIFSSVELCASFCPAVRHIGKLTAVEACTLPKSGESDTGVDKYQISRYYYDSTENGATKCKTFNFNGINMNLNNFKDDADCKAICATPLSTGT